MNMHDFEKIALCTLPTMQSGMERMEKGLMFADDHLEEAAAAFAQIENAKNKKGDEYVEAANRLTDMLGYMLADIALICSGMMMSMETVASRFIIKSLRPVDEAEDVREEEKAKRLLRMAVAMAGKVVQSDE